MPRSIRVRALDAVIRMEFDESVTSSTRRMIAALWNELTTDEHKTDGVVRVVATAVPASDHDEEKRLADQAASQTTLAAIEAMCGRAFMFHASAIALPNGEVIAFVGPSGRGKTTAALELGRRFGYVTDETLGVLGDGSVSPYRKPLSIGNRPGTKDSVAPATLGLQPLPAVPLRLAALVILDRRPDAEGVRVEHVDLIEAVAEIVPQTSSLWALPQPLVALTELIRSTGGVRRVVYREAAELFAAVPGILEMSVMDPAATGTLVTNAAGNGRPDDEASNADAYYRAPFHDAAHVDDRLVVLADRLTVLDGIGPTLWLAARGSTRQELLDSALRELPDPPPGVDAATVVERTLEELVGAGLVIRG